MRFVKWAANHDCACFTARTEDSNGVCVRVKLIKSRKAPLLKRYFVIFLLCVNAPEANGRCHQRHRSVSRWAADQRRLIRIDFITRFWAGFRSTESCLTATTRVLKVAGLNSILLEEGGSGCTLHPGRRHPKEHGRECQHFVVVGERPLHLHQPDPYRKLRFPRKVNTLRAVAHVSAQPHGRKPQDTPKPHNQLSAATRQP